MGDNQILPLVFNASLIFYKKINKHLFTPFFFFCNYKAMAGSRATSCAATPF
ncbi:hypothetical protein HanXRQr2_Chr14g0651851 [Helianthus annuus]|uniref:Uncharacterized protein n=1 Tax=Helianthus annuus TaxID=4232 RepID=A0A9K3H941_HELAN|nr:hypothetical protein HanXRQr2_Chr14g0651851 [Helianthus annuus]KAJ0840971.1 hypothetical protein HanPSC8_Chr14g0625081 [Helianthus annuus]